MENTWIIIGFIATVAGVISWAGLFLTERKLHKDIAELKEMINEDFQQSD